MAEQHITTNTPQEQITEEWRVIPGTEGNYAASTRGNLRRQTDGYHTRAGRIIGTSVDKDGYFKAHLMINGRHVSRGAHVYVALAFLGPCPEGKMVNHINGIKTDNRPENLEYVTAKENTQHAINHIPSFIESRCRGDNHPWRKHPELIRRGEASNFSKLNDKKVQLIRSECDGSTESIRRFAEELDVDPYTVKRAYQKITWRHVA